ncbi:MAG: nucleotide exchange factor GrpE [Treponema sp.]|nr:nucleotide exchange factor GrpE [Treponema sp.]
MAFFDFFWKKIEYYADTAAQNLISGINENVTEINERLRRIETKQKETSIQLEEIDNSLQNGSETALVEALVALTDIIADFYFFATADADSPLHEQAHMMWNTAKNAARATGLEIIEPDNEPFDFRLHSVEGAEQNIDVPNGYVIKTLKFGYIYKGEVIRRAAVIVNRIDNKTDNEIETRPNIIYL